MKTKHRHAVMLLLLVCLFAAPGITAYFIFYHPQWLSPATTNKGQLLNPPVLLSELGHDSRWHLLLWTPVVCDKDCVAQMDKLARIRLALGRRLYNVDLGLLSGANENPVPGAFASAFREQKVEVMTLSSDESKRWALSHKNPELFIADPDNYLVLAYPVTAQPDDLYHDIKHLLMKGN